MTNLIKPILFFLVVNLLFSCNISDSNYKLGNKSLVTDTIKIKDLIGTWTISVQINSGVAAKCNICPQLIFYNEGIGKFIKPSKEEFPFKYNLKTDTVIFSFEKGTDYFKELKFYYKVSNENNLKLLELNSLNGDTQYKLYSLN